MTDHLISRRHLLAGSAAGALASVAGPAGAGLVSASSGFGFEVQRSEAEWRAMLTEHEYRILREGETEEPRSSQWWDHEATGSYHCKGCDLPVYSSEFKINWKKGWVFFFHGMPDNVLMGIDRMQPDAYGDSGMSVAGPAGYLIETHCRRCGSHLGHIVMANLFMVHCINGAALTFEAA